LIFYLTDSNRVPGAPEATKGVPAT
jgi:hypothetical protein